MLPNYDKVKTLLPKRAGRAELLWRSQLQTLWEVAAVVETGLQPLHAWRPF